MNKQGHNKVKLSLHKTKIVCTVGPASRSPDVLEDMVRNGMNVARLNFSHGDFAEHKENIRNIRAAAAKLNRPAGIIVDLPGVKMRIGKLQVEPLVLKKGEKVTLTTREVMGTASEISVSYKQLPESVRKGGIIYLSDGFIQLKVESVSGPDILCRVVIGGSLLSHKGLNLPGAKLFLNPITDKDLEAVDFALRQGVTTFGLSFVEKAEDIRKVREFAGKMGRPVYLVAKIERREAIENFDEILKAADAIMIARGDLGIEIPIEEVPVVQKRLIRRANVDGRPVITATQMLGSMTQNVRPTRAEVTDVANAILDGTDAVMLSEETAVGDYPVETIRMMGKIAVATERLCRKGPLSKEVREEVRKGPLTIPDVISLNVDRAAEKLNASHILTQTSSGSTARHISRFKPPCWILAFSNQREICEFLAFSYGVYPFFIKKKNNKPSDATLQAIRDYGLARKGDTIIITERRLSLHPGETDSLSIATLA